MSPPTPQQTQPGSDSISPSQRRHASYRQPTTAQTKAQKAVSSSKDASTQTSPQIAPKKRTWSTISTTTTTPSKHTPTRPPPILPPTTPHKPITTTPHTPSQPIPFSTPRTAPFTPGLAPPPTPSGKPRIPVYASMYPQMRHKAIFFQGIKEDEFQAFYLKTREETLRRYPGAPRDNLERFVDIKVWGRFFEFEVFPFGV